MSSSIAASAIRTNRTNVVGTGLRLQSRIKAGLLGLDSEQATDWQQKTETEWDLWASDKRSCDATGVNDFYGLQQLTLISWLTSGDTFALVRQFKTDLFHPYALRLHVIEADRISTPQGMTTVVPSATIGKNPDNDNPIFDGVEVDKDTGQIVAYHIANQHPYTLTGDLIKWVRVEAYGANTGLANVLHVMDSERPEQYRGVTYLAQVIEPILQLNRYSESEMTAAIIDSFFTAFVKTEGDPSVVPYGSNMPEGYEADDEETEYSLGPGNINVMKPGESIDFADPKRPNAGFEGFASVIEEMIGAGIEVPAEILMKKFNASYSASRGALLEAWKVFKTRRTWLVSDLCRPAYEIWLTEAVARGRISAPGFFSDPVMHAAWLACEWTGPDSGQIDPLKEVQAEVLAIAHALSTHEQSTIRLNGGQWGNNVKQLTAENKQLAQANAPTEGSK
jgi:lambda family phage portal protein